MPSRVNKGFKWSFASTFAQGILQVVVTMTMARLLLPADYGLFAMVDVILRWAGLMAQMGLATVLIQQQRVTDHELRSARTLSLALGCLAAGTVALAAPLFGRWFGNPDVVPLLRVAAFSFVLSGLGLVSMAMLRRRMEFGRLGAAELAGYILGNGLTAIYLARSGAGVWSVVFGTLVGQLVQNVIAILLTRLPSGFSLDLSTLRPLLRNGTHVSVNTCLDIMNNTMDTFVIARVLPDATVGLFNRAQTLASLPANFLWTAVSRVAFPSYSRLQHDPKAFSVFLREVQEWSGMLCVAIPLSMIPAAPAIVEFLLGSTWLSAVPIVRLLLLAIAFDSLAFPYHSAMDALGCYGERTKVRLVVLVLRGASLALFAVFRTDALFYVASIATLSTWLISVAPVARRLGEPVGKFFRADLKVLLLSTLCAAGVGLAHYGAAAAGLPNTINLLFCIVAGIAGLGIVLRRHVRALLRKS